jgi:hypothetical protein
MNNTLKTTLLALAVTPGLLLSGTSAFAQDDRQSFTAIAGADDSTGTMTIVASEPVDGDHGSAKTQTFEVRVENGQIAVRQNGQDVPPSRIQHEDGQVVILDEDGTELKTIGLGVFTQPGGYFYRLGAAEGGNRALLQRLFAGTGASRGATADDEAGEAPKVMIGVHMAEPGPALEKHLKLKSGKCTMITGVLEGLPAEQSGVGEYDIIIAIDGNDEADAQSVRTALQGKEPGDSVSLRVIQAGKEKEITLRLQAYDAEKMQAAKLIGQAADRFRSGGFMPFEGQFPGNLEDWNIAVPEGMEGRLWLTPGGEWKGALPQLDHLQLEGMQQKWKELEPMIQQHLHDALKKYHAEAGDADDTNTGADVEKQLDRLDERLDQLEKMLQKLIEKQAKP